MSGQISSVRDPIGCQMKKAAISPPHSAAGRTWVSRFFTVTFGGIDAVLGQILGNEPRPGRADARRDSLAGKILRLGDLLARDDDIAFGVAFDRRDRAVVALDAEEVLHARKVAGHDDVALSGLKRLESGRAGREQPIGDVESFLLVEALLERHPDRVVVDGRLPEQRELERGLLCQGRSALRAEHMPTAAASESCDVSTCGCSPCGIR